MSSFPELIKISRDRETIVTNYYAFDHVTEMLQDFWLKLPSPRYVGKTMKTAREDLSLNPLMRLCCLHRLRAQQLRMLLQVDPVHGFFNYGVSICSLAQIKSEQRRCVAWAIVRDISVTLYIWLIRK